jgi:hypothetical protein
VLTVTVNGVTSVLMDGVALRHEVGVSGDPGRSTLTVSGEDLTVLMDLEKKENVRFPAMPPSLRVLTILAPYARWGVLPVVVPELIPQVVSPTDQIPAQNGTDLEYVKELADKNGYVFYLQPGPVPGMSQARWGPEIRVGVPQPALTVNSGPASNVDEMSFAFDGLGPEQAVVRVQIPQTRIALRLPVPDVGLLRPPLAARPAPLLKSKVIDDMAKENMSSALARMLGKAGETADAVSGSGQLDVLRYGRVLEPRALVGVRGAGLTYDGLYFVKSVTHNLKPGAYTQNFTLTREGLVSNVPRLIS